jgi:2-octaprenylphenol hydroxylase
MNHFDVIVIGGGSVGLTTACALGEHGVKVAVVEPRQAPDTADAGGHNPRVFAITRASQQIFTALGVWDGIMAGGAYPFHEMRVWDAGGDSAIHFDCADIGEPYLGHMIEPQVIQASLQRQVQSLGSVTLFCPARFTGIDVAQDPVTVTLDDDTLLSAGLVVGADGVNSPVREYLDIPAHFHDYRQSSLVARVRPEHDHQATAWQRFLPGGPLAFLPTADGWCSIVWTLPVETAQHMLTADKPVFHDALGEAIDFQLGKITDSEPREVFPLKRLHAEHYVREHVALAGDAAHAIHPLAGQGINLGLLDAAALAEVVQTARERQKNIGSLHVLRRYERWRRGDNQAMMMAMDGFNRLFGNNQPALCRVRNLGLALMDAASPAKDLLARHAMGLAGDLPSLARQGTYSPYIK